MRTEHLTDNEVVRILGVASDLTPREADLLYRLRRALDEIDRLMKESDLSFQQDEPTIFDGADE